ncbi:replication protein A 70 kDa DNA-binding subunit C-like [Senna tora]|uniref:Replication protein A 70 kDa DNA-binding subunit C-like n=1 Tax=Senna tora TaxID=362788 RepID=A0A834TQS9_9FABA|nr:replication protein A 70 kDa DNA-binding subunit C-like [Senna tora]
MTQMFDAVRHLDRSRNNWTIKVRVVRIWDTPPYPKTCAHHRMDMGSKIGGSVRSVFANKYRNILKEGGVYIMSGFNVVSANNTFRATNHAYKLNFQFSSRIARSNDDGSIHRYGFDFVSSKRIVSGELDYNILIDFIGRVCNISEPQSASSDPKTKRITLELEDSQRNAMLITLWGRYADHVVDFMANYSEGAIVVAIQFCKIKEYSGSISLSNSMFTTRLFINLDVNELIEFRQEAFNGLPLSLIDDLYHSGDRAVVCKRCAKKLEPDGTIFFCNKCQGLVNTSTSRFKIELMVMDASGTANITVFDREASNFLGMFAIELRKEHLENVGDPSIWPTKLDSFSRKIFVFKVAVKISQWNELPSFTIDLSSNNDDLITPVKDKSATIVGLEGRRLSFVDDSNSPTTATLSSGKRSVVEVSDDCTSPMDMSMNVDIHTKRIKIEKCLEA